MKQALIPQTNEKPTDRTYYLILFLQMVRRAFHSMPVYNFVLTLVIENKIVCRVRSFIPFRIFF
jgi:hypothetical protein